jgi:hypothetical protein
MAQAIVIVVATERIAGVSTATHALDAEQLLVRLTADRHRHDVVTRVGDRPTTTAAESAATTTTAATTSRRRRIHPDQGPDRRDRIAIGLAGLTTTASTPTAPASTSATSCSTSKHRGRPRRRVGTEAARAATPTRGLSRTRAERLPLGRRMRAILTTTPTTTSAATTTPTATTEGRRRCLRIHERRNLTTHGGNRG